MEHTHVFALLLMSVFSVCHGQSKTEQPTYNMGLITFNNQQTSVRAIKQDKKGDIWMVSTEGIIRYNGKSFTNITSKLGKGIFWDVLQDKRGNFWIASVGSGVYYYDGKSFKNYTTKDGLPSNSVFEIYEDKVGVIWFGTGEGPSRYDGKSFQNFKMKENPPPTAADSIRSTYIHPSNVQLYWMINETMNRVHTIAEDKNGNIWFGTWGDVCIYDGKTYTNITNKYGRTFIKAHAIIADKTGNIWLNGGGGLLRYDGKTFTNVPQRGMRYMIQDKKGNIWTTGEADRPKGTWALFRYDAKALYNEKPTITEIKSSANGLFGILEARDGSIWFGSSDGVYRYDGKTVKKF